ncbi:MAG: hypothetical protein KatS3mg050_2253 [Litorilinea sp.]|uniref:LytR family transcriptional regulator n=1 Tax=Litorilinea aerophila TaxID=1204385 RepID=A0A540VLH1_9CHLR|nr:MAG: hypothetical protein KatS3mg050_2253 [Litorilinea sp.]
MKFIMAWFMQRPDSTNEAMDRKPAGRPPGERTTLYRRLAIAGSVFYVIFVLTFALLLSNRLYDWARLRILNSSPLANLPEFEMLAPASLQSVTEQPAPENNATADAQQQPEVTSATVDTPKPAINVLLLGTDGRPGEQDIPRTDTIILLSLDLQSGTLGMLSLPRDLWVPIPGYDITTKINTAYSIGELQGYQGGGAQLVKNTVSSFIGQPVQYYVMVNFQGFVELIDLIGGVDVMVPKTIHDEEFPTDDYGVETFHLDAGLQHLDGATALKYVRTRHVDDDYGRARRQQDVIRAVVDKVMRSDMLPTLLARLPKLLYTMRNSIDTDIPMPMQLELANYIKDVSLNEVRQLVLDNRFGEETYSAEGAWILRPDRAKVRAALADFFNTAGHSGNGTTVAQASADPAWVRVEILNGTGEPGVAARTRELLEARGWQVVSIGDADRSDYGRTLVINYGVPDELVEKVGADLDLQPNLSSLHGLNTSAPVDVRIVVGRDILAHIR